MDDKYSCNSFFFCLVTVPYLTMVSYRSYFASTYLLINQLHQNGLPRWNWILLLTRLRFIHNWVITDRFHPVDGALVRGVCSANEMLGRVFGQVQFSIFGNSTFCQIRKSTRLLFPYFAKFTFRVFANSTLFCQIVDFFFPLWQLHLVLPNFETFSSLATPLWQIGCQIGTFTFAQLNSQVNFVIKLAFPSCQLHIAILRNIHKISRWIKVHPKIQSII